MLRNLMVRTLVVGLGVFSWVFASASHAATWDGGGADSNWATALNWNPDTAPVANDILLFGGTTKLANTNNTAANTQYNGISFLPGAGAFTLGGNAVQLMGDITQDSNNNQTISLPLNLDLSTVNVGGTGTGTLSLGQVTFGTTVKSPNVSTLNLNRTVSATGLNLQTKTATANTISIASGQALNVSGTVLIGTPAVVGEGFVDTNLDMTGGGDFNVITTTNTNFFAGVNNVSNTGSTGNDRSRVRVNMTALSNFTYSTGATGTGQFGVGFSTRPDAQLRLAAVSNNITAATITVGNSGITPGAPNLGTADNNGTVSTLFLGNGTNVLNTGNLNIGFTKSGGVVTFNDLVNGSVTIQGQAGVGTRANITLSNMNAGTGAAATSQLLLAGHSANVNAGNVVIGRTNNTSGAAGGEITFDNGTFNVNSLQIAHNQGSTNPSGTFGRFIIGGGTLTVNNEFILGNDTNTGNAGKTDATLTINGGIATINAPITRVSTGGANAGDASVINLNAGTLNMTGKNIGSIATPLTAVNLLDGNFSNAARVTGNAITLGGTLNISGTPTFVLPDAGTLTSSLTTLNLPSGGGIEGGGVSGASVTGNVVAQTGSHITVGNSATPSTLTFNNDLSLSNGSAVNLELSDNSGFGNDVLTVNGNLAVAGTVNINIDALGAGATIGQTYTLMNYFGTLTGNQSNFAVDAGGTRKTFTIVPTNTTPNSIQAAVGGSGPANLTWIGNVNNEWDLKGDANWSGGQQFFNSDNVTFDNTSSNFNPVQLVGSLKPSSVTVGGTRNYTFAGSGSIDGSAVLTKNGSGTLSVTNANGYSGGTQINGGVVEIGTGGSLGTGDIGNDATLRFNRTDTVTISAAITGSGVVQNSGSGVTILSSAGNAFFGGLQVNSGTVRSTALTSAGSGTITVAAGGTFAASGAVAAANSTTIMNGGTLAAIGADYSPQGDMTVNGPITVTAADNATPTTSRNVQVDGVLHGNGTINVVQANGINNADASQGFRLRNVSSAAGYSDYTGTITVNQTAKFELRKVQATAGSPMGTGKVVLTAGTFDGGNSLTGTYSVFNLRNNTGGNTVFGNDVEISGTGGVSLNLLTNADGGGTAVSAGTVSTLGNLKIGTGQELALYKAAATPALPLAAEFTSVTLTGNGATFSAKRPGFGATNSDGSDLIMGTITEQAAGYGINVTGTAPRSVSIIGATNYTGNTKVDSGILTLAPPSGPSNLANTADVYVAAGALLNLNFSGTDTIDSLFLGGVPAAVGDWGSSVSGAPNVSELLGGTGILHVSTLGTIGVLGDFNNNGVVDAADYVTWREFGASALPNDGGAVDQAARYAVWRSNFGNTSASGGTIDVGNVGVPEPTAGLLALSAVATVVLLGRRRPIGSMSN